MVKIFIFLFIFCIGVYYGIHHTNNITSNIDYYGKHSIAVESKIINNQEIINYYHQFKEKFL